jgi:hypothetical protein
LEGDIKEILLTFYANFMVFAAAWMIYQFFWDVTSPVTGMLLFFSGSSGWFTSYN